MTEPTAATFVRAALSDTPDQISLAVALGTIAHARVVQMHWVEDGQPPHPMLYFCTYAKWDGLQETVILEPQHLGRVIGSPRGLIHSEL